MICKKYKMGEVCDLITDYVANGSFKTLAQNVQYLDNGFARVIRQVDFNNNFSEKKSIWVSEESYNFLSKTKLHGGEIIVSNVGNIGLTFLVPNKNYPMTLGPNSIMIKAKQNNLFLYYWLVSTIGQNKIKTLISGSAMPKFNKTAFRNMEIVLPDETEQARIVNILKPIDDKIQLNNKLSEELHELGKNLYESMIVNHIDNANSEFEWKKDKLGNYLSINRGLSYKGKFLSDEGVPMINLGNIMPDGIFRIEKNKYYTGDFKEKVTTNVGDMVIANTDMTQNRDVIGIPVIVPPIYDDKIIFSHHIYGVSDLKLPKMFIYYTLLRNEFRSIAGGSATGTTVLFLPKEVIENYEIDIPDEDTLKSFEEAAKKIYDRRVNILLENIDLEDLKSNLLDQLINFE